MRRVFGLGTGISALLLVFASCGLGAGENTEIRVKLVDAHSGKPYASRHVEIFGTNAPPGSGLHPNEIFFHLQGKTGPDGVARFQIPAPLPYRLVFNSAQANGCGPPGFASFVTGDVLRSGMVVPNTCAGKHQKYDWREVTAQPGEIVIFAVEPRGP